MTEKKFNVSLIIMGAVSLALGCFSFCFEAIVVGIVTLIISIVNKEKYRVKIPVALSIAGIVLGICMLAFMFYTCTVTKNTTGYWFVDLFF